MPGPRLLTKLPNDGQSLLVKTLLLPETGLLHSFSGFQHNAISVGTNSATDEAFSPSLAQINCDDAILDHSDAYSTEILEPDILQVNKNTPQGDKIAGEEDRNNSSFSRLDS